VPLQNEKAKVSFHSRTSQPPDIPEVNLNRSCCRRCFPFSADREFRERRWINLFNGKFAICDSASE
jgi:hypothetical protein